MYQDEVWVRVMEDGFDAMKSLSVPDQLRIVKALVLCDRGLVHAPIFLEWLKTSNILTYILAGRTEI